jgi:UDP-N-acetylglucosamine--N-acetylmuramyl-(pentapeptide) pyrophosphoryl-undecaprenol N-acetylglucosamine transferase
MALVREDAAVMLRDDEVASRLPDLVLQLSANVSRRRQLSENIRKLALPGSADTIAAEVLRMSGK